MNSKFSIQQIQKLKNFFVALKFGGLKTNINQVSSRAADGSTIDKQECLKLLRELPEFKGEEFKDDNFLISNLSKKLQTSLDRSVLLNDLFTLQEQQEFSEALKDEEPTATETTEEQQAAQQGQATTGGEQPGTMGEEGHMPGLPTAGGAAYQTRRPVRVVHPPAAPPIPDVPGLKTTPETGLDYEGKPYEMDAEHIAQSQRATAKASTAEQTEGKAASGRKFQAPKLPAGLANTLKNFGSAAGRFFQRNLGKFLTVGRIGTAVSTGIGALAGSAFGSTGMFAGAGAGAILPSFVKSGGARNFLGKVGNGIIDRGARLSNGISRGGLNIAGPKKRIWILLLVGMLGFSFLTAFTGAGTPGGGTTGGPNPTPGAGGGGGSCPTAAQLTTNATSPQTCQYLNPGIDIFNTTFTDTQIKQYISFCQSQSSSCPTDVEAKTRTIVTEAQSVGLNPIIPLGYWFTESKFGEGFGCPAVTNSFQNQLDCILGGPPGSTWQSSPVIYTPAPRCARDKDASSAACRFVAGQISGHPNIYNSIQVQVPINNFDALAEMIGPRAPNLDGPGTTNNNCTHTYNQLIQVAVSVNACTLATASSGSSGAAGSASCPIPGGVIGCASYGTPYSSNGFGGSCRPDSTGNGGHCNANYISDVQICTTPKDSTGNYIRTAKSIDVSNNSRPGDPVYLPSINNHPVTWQYVGAVSAGGNFGWIRIFHSVNAPEGVWSLHFVHVNQNQPAGINPNDTIQSGQVGATILNPWIPGDNYSHVHVTVGLNVGDAPPGNINDLKDYSPNWKFADRDLGMCTGGTTP